MKHSMKVLAAIALAATTLTGCDGENWFANTDVDLVDAPASFRAVEFDFVNEAGDIRDVIAEGGRFELTLDDDLGEFDATFEVDGRTFRTDGTFAMSGNEIVFSDDPFTDDDLDVQRSLELVRSDDVILLADPEAVFDVDGDGFTEVVEMNLRLERI